MGVSIVGLVILITHGGVYSQMLSLLVGLAALATSYAIWKLYKNNREQARDDMSAAPAKQTPISHNSGWSNIYQRNQILMAAVAAVLLGAFLGFTHDPFKQSPWQNDFSKPHYYLYKIRIDRKICQGEYGKALVLADETGNGYVIDDAYLKCCRSLKARIIKAGQGGNYDEAVSLAASSVQWFTYYGYQGGRPLRDPTPELKETRVLMKIALRYSGSEEHKELVKELRDRNEKSN